MRGYKIKLHKLDNETSRDVEELIADQQAKIQYTPADTQRTNIAERCIRTWKNHFATIRAGAEASFPMYHWCRMLEQADITLNMMRPCTMNPKLSAFEAMEGSFSFSATYLALVGTKMMIHLKPARRHTWDYEAIEGLYIGPSLQHYHVVRGLTKHGHERLTDMWKFQHHVLGLPEVTQTDRIVKA